MNKIINIYIIIIMTTCILTKEQYIFLWKISFLSLISCIYAIYKNHYDLALVPGGVFLTSINYWRYPLGIYFYKKKLYWYSVYAHSMIHVLGNVSNIILYSGCILAAISYV